MYSTKLNEVENVIKKVLAKWNEIVNAKWIVDVVIFHIENYFLKKLAKENVKTSFKVCY
jgi:hypothetical protein